MPNEGTTILLAEDDIILAELYTDRLKQEGFNVIHAANGEDALSFVREYNPNLIILDIMMPKMNGLDVLKALKEDPATARIPVIIVTALVQEIEKVNKMMNPADAYIVKSEVLPAEIIEQVKKRLENEDGAQAAAPTAAAATAPAAPASVAPAAATPAATAPQAAAQPVSPAPVAPPPAPTEQKD